ncbi:hypothetical protein Hanom_Chr02g00106801 [Helianthus anomalus]
MQVPHELHNVHIGQARAEEITNMLQESRQDQVQAHAPAKQHIQSRQSLE